MAGAKPWAAVALSRDGARQALRVREVLAEGQVDVYVKEPYGTADTLPVTGRIGDFFGELMGRYEVIVAVMAAGIVVRAAAPHLVHKSKDPAVLVMDAAGKYVISLISGHLGGANDAAVLLAKGLGAQPVITTGTDVKGTMAVDVLARKLGLAIADFTAAKDVTAAILDEEPVTVYDTAGLDFSGIVLPFNLKVEAMEPEAAQDGGALIAPCILISDGRHTLPPRAVQLVPKTVAAGLGCRKDTPGERIIDEMEALLAQAGLHPQAVESIATISLKAGEPGIARACAHFGAALRVIPDEFVKMVQGRFEGSDFVEKTTGMRSVCEPCGYVASRFGPCLAPKRKCGGITLSLWRIAREGETAGGWNNDNTERENHE